MVTRDTRDQDFAANRQLFLTEQGYQYEILYENEVADFHPPRPGAEVPAGPPACPTRPYRA